MANPHELYAQLTDDLFAVKKEGGNIIQRTEQSIIFAENALIALNEVIKDHIFSDAAEEIHFYKDVKPSFQSHIIFHKRVFQIEIARPPGGPEEQEAYLRKELEKLQAFFVDHKFIYQYLRSGLTYLDEKLFFRPKDDSTIGMRMYSLRDEPFFPTSFDTLVAKVKANDLLFTYLTESLEDLKDTGPNAKSFKPTLYWTGSKAALIELGYALQAKGVFNDGKTDLREVMEGLQMAFQIDLGNYPRTFQEILYRKSGYTVFQDDMKHDYLLYIQRIEEKHIR